jgi:hypothetical protein
MPTVEILNIGPVDFPDTMSANDINLAIRKITNPTAQTQQKNSLGIPVGENEQIMPVPPEQKRSLGDYVKPIAEIPATMLSNAALAIPSAFADPKNPTALMDKYSYKPESPVTKDILGGMADALRYVPPYIGTGLLPTLGKNTQLLKQPTEIATQAVTQPVAQQLAQALRKEPVSSMSGVGAADVPKVLQRIETAQNLRVPVPVTKGNVTRELGQQAFEAETPKNYPEISKPLVQRTLDQNEKMLQNFDAYVDATGSQSAGPFNLRAVGKVVDKALVNSANDAWKKTGDAYTLAREAGEMQAPVNYQPLQQYIKQFENRPTLKSDLASIINIVDDEIKINDPKKTGKMSINQLEDIYELINKSYDPSSPSATYAKEMKKLINGAMEGQGGELYQKARQLRTKYANEFENVGFVDKLLRTKPNTKDRAVAFEDVFDHSIMKGSLDDVMAVGRALKKAGPDGQQAWKELQGQTIEQLKSTVTKNIKQDQNGNKIISPSQFDSFVRELDQDGKLDYLFGKSGANEIRDLRDTALTIYNPVPGAVNYPNTSSAIIRGLDSLNKSMLGAIPGVKSVTKNLAESSKERIIKKQIEESINFDPKKLAEQLRKEQ